MNEPGPQIKWLIEADVFGRDTEPVKSAIQKNQMVFDILQPRRFLNGVIPDPNGRRLGSDECVIFWGSPPLLKHLRIHYPGWVPGGWSTFENFECEHYYPILSKYLLNSENEIATVDELLAKPEQVFERFAVAGEVFVRPSSHEKVFTGHLVTAENFGPRVAGVRYSRSKIVVARPQPITYEWRVIMQNHEPITGSQYKKAGQMNVTADCPETVLSYVRSVWNQLDWTPDLFFVVDVAETAGELRIIELNGFSCAGWYQCDPETIVTATRDAALEAWAKACGALNRLIGSAQCINVETIGRRRRRQVEFAA